MFLKVLFVSFSEVKKIRKVKFKSVSYNCKMIRYKKN